MNGRDSKELVTPLKIPRNEAGLALAEQIAACQRQRLRILEESSGLTAQRSRRAGRETRLQKAEAKMIRECAAVRAWERNAAYEQSKNMRRRATHGWLYMADATHQRKQDLLTQMLVDDRLHPRCSHPTPVRVGDLEDAGHD